MSSVADIRDIRLCMMGFGHVAQRFCEIAADREESLADEQGIRLLVTTVGTASHGSMHDPVGLPPRALLETYREAGSTFINDRAPARTLIADSGADVLIESTPLEAGGATSLYHLETAFDHGLDAITVNKGPIAWHYQRIRQYAMKHDRRFRFEGVTMDGCPVYNLVERCLPGDRVTGFRGVLNSTTNYVLDALAQGLSMPDAIEEAKAEGITEADPTDDIEGHDAAAKVAALANVLLDANITPEAVTRDSIADVTPDDVARVLSYGRRLRVVCSATRTSGGVVAQATLEPLRSDDPMYWISGTSSALVLTTELAGTIEIVERDGLLTQTAYAILADLLTLYA